MLSLRPPKTVLAACAALACVLAIAPAAGASDVFNYSVIIKPATNTGTPDGYVSVSGLDAAKTTTIRLKLGGVLQAPSNFAAGATARGVAASTIASGDQIQVEQPTGVLLETFTVPAASMTGAAGSPVVTGQAPDGAVRSEVIYYGSCTSDQDEEVPVQPQGGAFTATLPRPLEPGSRLSLSVYPGKGDEIHFDDNVPGETPCFSVDAFDYPERAGDPADPTPFRLQVSGLRKVVATGARLILRRAGIAVADFSDAAATSSVYTNIATQPQAGDVLELYRPHTAPAPSATFTIPSLRSVYDASVSLVAVDAPAASRISAYAGSLYAMFGAERNRLDAPAGRTVFNFGADDGNSRAIPLSSVDFVLSEWSSPDSRGRVQFGSAPGDLVPPSLKLKIAAKLRASKLGSSVPLTVTAGEAASSKVTLTLPAKLKTAAAKPRTIASGKPSLKAGTNKLRLKLSKSGKKLLAMLRKRRYPTQTATLTVTATDASGNSSTSVKRTKLVPR